MSLGAPVCGSVAPGFEPVAKAFEHNFTANEELGAAFAAYLGGKPVVDLWGGLADRASAAPWRRETLQVVYSGTKGWLATSLLVLIERGRLELHSPVARYWPECAAGGKEGLLVEHLVSHRAGLPGLLEPILIEQLGEGRRLAELLARQEPFWPPGSRVVYHPLTFGWLCGELIRRIDGRSAGRFFAEEVAQKLGLEAWIGLPTAEQGRVATLEHHPRRWGRRASSGATPAGVDRVLFDAIWNNPAGRHGPDIPWNRPGLRAVEVPAANGVATARSVARLYGCLANGGALDGTRLLEPPSLLLGRQPLAGGHDPYLDTPVAYGVGFQLQTEARRLGAFEDAFGHAGSGGSVHGAWPSQGVGFSYVTNQLRDDAVDERAADLLRALALCIEPATVGRPR